MRARAMKVTAMKVSAMKVSTVLLGVLAVCAAGRASAQTLADVARAEQERRKAVGAAAKVYTNGSLKAEPLPSAPPMPAASVAGAPGAAPASGAPASAPAVSGAGTAPATPANAPGGTAPNPAAPGALPATALPTTEEGWRARISGLKDGLSRNQVIAEALQSRINALLTDFVNRDDPAQRAVVETDRIRALAELDRVRSDIKAAQQAVAELEEQARRAGVPPGWLR